MLEAGILLDDGEDGAFEDTQPLFIIFCPQK
jgi:hypothetical protein